MKRRYALIGLGLIAMVALVSTAIAGGGIGPGAHAAKKARRGPAGPAGPAGAAGAVGPAGVPGANGAAGAPKAYGGITYTTDTPTIVGAQSSNITAVTETTTGTGAGSDGFVCIDVAVPFNTAVATPVFTAAFAIPDVSVWIPATPGPPFTVGACPAASDLMVLVNNSNTGTFQKGSFTIALF